MLANIIVNALDGSSGGLGLTKGTNLFAEQARGDKHVLVSATNIQGDEIPVVRYAAVNVLVTGWDIRGGAALAERVANKILAMEGGTYTYSNSTLKVTERYNVCGVSVRNWPTLFTAKDKVTFTCNVELSYKLATA